MASKARKAWEIEYELLNSAKSKTNKLPTGGAMTFPALWHLAEGLFLNYFSGKRRIS